MSYNINTEEVLKIIPKSWKQVLANLPLKSRDVEIITDLMSTNIDEEATAINLPR